ncbi:MAG: LptF/LptG family permease [Pseudomonadota bacterium]|nr:LptF/LptG family permease [Pseudomonadota bacterium]
MTGQLPAYLRRRVGLQILALLAVLTAMMQLLELLDVTTEVLERGLGVVGLLHYAVLRLPAELGLALPLAVLLGTMTALNSMARALEITAMRASGVSLMRMLGYLVPVLLVLATVQVALLQVVLPRVEIELKQWWSASAPPAEKVTARLWAHTRGGLVSIETFSPDGRQLQGVRLYERQAGLLTARLRAASARWDGEVWQLEDVTVLRIEAAGVRRIHEDAREWRTNLHPDEVLRLGVARPYLSSIMLNDVIVGSRVGSQPLSYYQTALYRSFAAPLGVFIMLLLALPTATTLARGKGGGAEMLVALMLGLGFLLSDGIVAALGSSGRLPPLVTALVAPLLFTSIGFLRLRACERP